MGCDIHGYVDYDDPKIQEMNKERGREPYVQNWGRFSVHRNYWLFGILAGVRCEDESQAIVPRRGLPEYLSWRTQDEATLYVLEDEKYEKSAAEGCCSRSDAERWGSRYVNERKTHVHHPDWHSHSWLTTEELGRAIEEYCKLGEPEFKMLQKNEDGTWPEIPEGWELDNRIIPKDWQVDEKWKIEAMHVPIITKDSVPFKCPPEVAAIHSGMKALEESGMIPRFVFWFDN